MKPRIVWGRPKPSPKGDALPPPAVYILCRRSGDWIGDVIWMPPGETFWRGGRYHVFLSDRVCGHVHVAPTDAEVAKRVAEAEQAHATVPLRVSAKR